MIDTSEEVKELYKLLKTHTACTEIQSACAEIQSAFSAHYISTLHKPTTQAIDGSYINETTLKSALKFALQSRE